MQGTPLGVAVGGSCPHEPPSPQASSPLPPSIALCCKGKAALLQLLTARSLTAAGSWVASEIAHARAIDVRPHHPPLRPAARHFHQMASCCKGKAAPLQLLAATPLAAGGAELQMKLQMHATLLSHPPLRPPACHLHQQPCPARVGLLCLARSLAAGSCPLIFFCTLTHALPVLWSNFQIS